MMMELLAGLLGLTLLTFIAIAARRAVVPALVHAATFSSGILLYVSVQQVSARWPDMVRMLEMNSAAMQLGVLLGVCLELTLLGLILLLPFNRRRRGELEGMLGVTLYRPAVYPLVWIGGSLAYHCAAVSPHFLTGSFVWTDHDAPLAFFVPLALSASVMFRMHKTPGAAGPAPAAEPAGAPSVDPAEHPEPHEEEEVLLKKRVESLRAEAELAERQWAAAVLKERAARTQAERFAREFAEARRKMESQAAERQIPVAMTLEIALKVLRLTPGCTEDEAKEAYRRRVTKYHPDRVTLFGSQIRETAERETKRINLAYEIVRRSITAPRAASHRPS